MAIGAGNAGAWAAVNATTQTVTLPTHAAGTQLILIAACKAATPASVDIQVTTPSTGWEKVAQFADGTTASGVGTGSVVQAIFRRICTSSSETNPVVTWGGSQTSTPGIAVAVGFTKAAGEVWLLPAVVQAATTNATSISVTMGSNPGITGGDFGLAVHTTRDDSALTVPTWSATGTTLGTATVFPATPIASGTSDDMAGTIAYRSVTSGLATAAPVVTATQAAAETGVTAFVRLRVGNIAPNRKLLSATRNTTGTSTVATGSVTVSAGNTIFVVAASYVNSAFGSESVTDNLGNVYSLVVRRRRAADFERLSLYAAPVTAPGTMTTLTYNHDSSQFVGTVSIEYTGVGLISGAAYSGDGNGTTNTWLSSSSIPAGGAAIGGTMNSATTDTSAGAASGSPSTTIVEVDGWSTSGMGASLFNALAPAAVTGFTGTATTVGAVDWVGVGAVYNAAANVTVTPTTAALVLTTFAPTVTVTAVPVTGTGAGTQAAQTATGSGTSVLDVTGTGAGTQTAQSGSGAALETFTGTGAGTQAAQTSSGAGVLTIATGTGAGTQVAQSASGTGDMTEPATTGTGAGTQTAQSGSGAGLETISGTGAATQTTQSGSGSATETFSGTGAGTQAAQTASGSGSTLLAVSGTGAGVQAPATASGTGLQLQAVTGTGAGTQQPATGYGVGIGGVSTEQPPSHGHGPPLHAARVTGPAGDRTVYLRPVTGTGHGEQPAASAHGTGFVNDDELVLLLLEAA